MWRGRLPLHVIGESRIENRGIYLFRTTMIPGRAGHVDNGAICLSIAGMEGSQTTRMDLMKVSGNSQ